MGYKKTVQYRGLTVPDAYHRIDSTSSADGQCEASLNIYTTREAFIGGEGYLEQRLVAYPIIYGSNAGADKNQGYGYILSLAENADAESVFEEEQPG